MSSYTDENVSPPLIKDAKRKKEKKTKENGNDREVTDVAGTSLNSEKRKRKTAELEFPEGGNIPETVQETTKKKRRCKPVDDELERPKKKSKKIDLPDPGKDLTLSGQAQKALSYAFTQFRHPKKWKFHKARQNWLIRNFWSDKTIPDLHVPLVLKYFANVQGGARESMMKTCMLIISVSQDDKTQENQEIEQTGAPPIQHDEIKRKRAMELSNILQTSPA